MKLEEFLDKYGDEITGILMRGFGEDHAARETVPRDEVDAYIGRSYKRREKRALEMLRRIYTDFTEKTSEQPKNEHGAALGSSQVPNGPGRGREPDSRPASNGQSAPPSKR